MIVSVGHILSVGQKTRILCSYTCSLSTDFIALHIPLEMGSREICDSIILYMGPFKPAVKLFTGHYVVTFHLNTVVVYQVLCHFLYDHQFQTGQLVDKVVVQVKNLPTSNSKCPFM